MKNLFCNIPLRALLLVTSSVSAQPLVHGESGETLVNLLSDKHELLLFRRALQDAGLVVAGLEPSSSSANGDYDYDSHNHEYYYIRPKTSPPTAAPTSILSRSDAITLFAPINSAFQHPDIFLLYSFYNSLTESWMPHLRHLLLNQFVDIEAFSEEELLSGAAGGSLRTATGDVIRIQEEEKQTLIGGQTMVTLDGEQDMWVTPGNGFVAVVHAVDGFFAPGWIDETLMDLVHSGTDPKRHGFVLSRLSVVLGQDSFSALAPPLKELRDGGTTLIAPSNQAFAGNGTTIFDSDAALYHIVDHNLFESNLIHHGGACAVFGTMHPSGANLMGIRSSEDGTFRYNGLAQVQHESLANNGVLHVTDQLLRPPGMVELLGYAAGSGVCLQEYTDCHKLLVAMDWNQQNLSQSLGGHGFTILCPFDGNSHYGVYPRNLVNPGWSAHRQEFVQNMVIPGIYTKQELEEKYLNREIVTTIGGTNITLGGTSGQGSAHPLLKGVDGAIFLAPTYLSEYWAKPTLSNLVINYYSQQNQIPIPAVSFNARGPHTFFAPPNVPLAFSLSQQEEINLNHVFVGNLYMTDLLQMDGETLTSANGKSWLVSVLNQDVFLQSSVEPTMPPVLVLSEDNESNVLAQNGVFYKVDGPLLDGPVATVDDVKQGCGVAIDKLRLCSYFPEPYYIAGKGRCSDYDELDSRCVQRALSHGQRDLESYYSSDQCDIFQCECCQRRCEQEYQDVVVCAIKLSIGVDLSSCKTPTCKHMSESQYRKQWDSSDDGIIENFWWIIPIVAGVIILVGITIIIWKCRKAPRDNVDAAEEMAITFVDEDQDSSTTSDISAKR